MILGRRSFIIAGLLILALIPAAQGCAQDQPTRISDVVYGHKMGVALTMDVFKPQKPNGIGMIWIVSGGWYSNHDNINPGMGQYFASRGITVFEVVHGSQPRFTLPEIVQDIHRAVRFIRVHAAEYGVDPNRMGISGASAGGHLSLMMAAYGGPGDPTAKDPVDRASSQVQAAAVFFPPTDFLNYGKPGARTLSTDTLREYWHVFAAPANATEEDKDKIARPLSPIYGVSKNTPPVLIFHGDADKLVPIQQSESFMAKLEEFKVPHKLLVRPGQAHGWATMDKDMIPIGDWFEKYLGKKSP